jgi:hypothetical protein
MDAFSQEQATVPLVNAGRRQSLTTPCSCETLVQAENTEKKYFKYAKNSVNSVVKV